ncbi:MAG: hypothetical protein KDD11_18485 [Acidobacteria bacterium]|nr:hypothetical protein [Acidobacteriota bacterium]
MVPKPQIEAFRHLEHLVVAVYEATDGMPRGCDPEVVRRLRTAATSAGDSYLDGCSTDGVVPCRHRWNQSLVLLEEVANLVDVADDAGFLDRETVLSLLEVQSAAVVRLLILLDELPGTEPVLLKAA